MIDIFISLFNMSISASWLILAVILIRLLLKRCSKRITMILWGFVAFRLICPFTFESFLSLIPSAEILSKDIIYEKNPTINSGINIVDDSINPVFSESFSPEIGASANPLQIILSIISFIWILGMIALILYSLISYLKLKKNLSTAVLMYANIYQSENVKSPFVLGFIKSKIYLPYNINTKEIQYIVAHEQNHIKRKDHILKPFGFLIATIYWFNPIIWFSYILFCRDIELACDESVIKTLDRDSIADYSQALLLCSTKKRLITMCPLSFGETAVKTRIKSILNYKKTSFWMIILAIIAIIIVLVCFLTSPVNEDDIGVNEISIKRIDDLTYELTLEYAYPIGGYSVTVLDENEGEYIGDGMIEYDGSLGKYRVMITFGDIHLSKSFKNSYPDDGIIEVDGSPIRIKTRIAHPSDHGFVLYLGFDQKVFINNIDYTKFSQRTTGELTIPIYTQGKPKDNEFDTDWIIGKTSLEIEERYGEFEYTYGHRRNNMYYNGGCGYMTKEGKAGFFGTPPDEFFVIHFDSNGIAYKIVENELRGGG